MRPGYDHKLYILAFDHRGSFQKKFFGIDGEPDAEQTAMIADAKHLIYEGLSSLCWLCLRREGQFSAGEREAWN